MIKAVLEVGEIAWRVLGEFERMVRTANGGLEIAQHDIHTFPKICLNNSKTLATTVGTEGYF